MRGFQAMSLPVLLLAAAVTIEPAVPAAELGHSSSLRGRGGKLPEASPPRLIPGTGVIRRVVPRDARVDRPPPPANLKMPTGDQ